MRNTPDVSLPPSHHRLAMALLCAVGCLNPLPEEYPSETVSPDVPAAAAGSEPSDLDVNPTSASESAPAPASDQEEPPASIRIALPPADAGAAPDGGAGDAEPSDAGPADAGAPPNED